MLRRFVVLGLSCLLAVAAPAAAARASNGNGNNGNGNGNSGNGNGNSGNGNSGAGNNGNGTGTNAGNGNGNNGNGNGNGGSGTGTAGTSGGDLAGCGTAASGNGSEFIPDLSAPFTAASTTTFRVCARQQARVTVPGLVVFNVTDVAQATPQDGTAAISADHIALFAGRHLEIAIAPAADAFVDETNQLSYAASKVSWAGLGSSQASVVPGAFVGAATYAPFLVCAANTNACAGTVQFTLAADPSQSVAGQHVLLGMYRVTSVL